MTATPHPAVTATGTRLIVGPPGSGKTTLLLHAAAHAVKAGTLPQRIALLTFAYRSTQHIKHVLQHTHPQLSTSAIQVLTVRDLAAQQLAHQHLQSISNNSVRALLRQLIVTQGFTGTLTEAEHIIRTAKSKGKRPSEADPHYPLFTAYKDALETRNLTDRHDIIRRHVLSMKDDTAQPAPVEMILIDNIQDATELQLIWLKEHHLRGVTVVATGCDDTTAFGRDGALGPTALETFESWPAYGPTPVATYALEEHYRTPATLAPAVAKTARFLKTRRGLTWGTAHNPAPATFTARDFPTRKDEHAFLLSHLQTLLKTHTADMPPIGVVTRFDQSAQNLTHILRKNGLTTGSYARLVWEEPSAQIVLALLHVLLNLASTQQLAMVLAGFGIPADVVQAWVQQGLQGKDFLQKGAELPPAPNASPTTHQAIKGTQVFLRLAWRGLTQRLADPRLVFQAAVQALLTHLPPADHPDALLATDTLLSLSGNLADILPKVTTETLPSPTSPIIVAPVREVRNLTFSTLILPHAETGHWPAPPLPTLGENADHERRLFLLAISRTQGHILATHTGPLSPMLAEFEQGVRTAKRLG